MEPVEALKRGDEAISWLVDAISHISSFRGDASVYTWLYAILLRRCRRMQVREAISALDHKYREAIVLFYYEEFCGCWPASTKLALTAWRKKIGTTGTSLTTTWKRAWLSWSVSRNCSQAQRWKRPCAQSAACCPDSLTADRTVKPQDCPTSARCVTIWMAIAYRICPSRSGVPPR